MPRGSCSAVDEARYDAVVVCNGHYTQPRIPKDITDEGFPGHVMHSHNYRTPERFRGKRVAVLGASSSGEDISRELSTEAAMVYLCARTWQNPQWGFDSAPVGERGNLVRKAAIQTLRADGRVQFSDGSVTADAVDCVLYCTGGSRPAASRPPNARGARLGEWSHPRPNARRLRVQLSLPEGRGQGPRRR